MQKIELKFDQPEEIIDFVRIMNRYECDADVKYGSMVVDAKSIVGVLSLARSKTVEVILHTDECQNLLDEIAQHNKKILLIFPWKASVKYRCFFAL